MKKKVKHQVKGSYFSGALAFPHFNVVQLFQFTLITTQAQMVEFWYVEFGAVW